MPIEKFIGEIANSLREKTFVKLTLGNYKGSDEHLQKILIRLIETKKGVRLYFQYRYATRDLAKNYSFDEGLAHIRSSLGADFFNAHLFTTENDLQLDIGKRSARIHSGEPTFKASPPVSHDREKKIQIDPNAFYLKALGITNDNGEVRDKQQDKWRQINKFVEILGSLYEKSTLKNRSTVNIVDMGSGKGYLTFAAYDYFTTRVRTASGSDRVIPLRDENELQKPARSKGVAAEVRMTGVDTKREMVDLCNQIAKAGEYEGLRFVEGTIADFDPGDVDILIALHACDTATDDALFKGITANAEIIVAAPCCHKEIRPQIKPPEMFSGILKHGIMLERTAETITDGLRSLLLERSGYATKLFEFIGTEHTPKNNMLVGTRNAKLLRTDKIDRQITEIKDFYGIGKQRLEGLLKS